MSSENGSAYVLWETATRNRIAGFARYDEALAFVRTETDAAGIAGIETWALLEHRRNQTIRPHAAGLALLTLARSYTQQRAT